MQLKQLDLPGGGLLTVYLRDCVALSLIHI